MFRKNYTGIPSFLFSPENFFFSPTTKTGGKRTEDKGMNIPEFPFNGTFNTGNRGLPIRYFPLKY